MIVWDLGDVVADFRPDRRLRALARATGLAEAVIHERIWDSGLEAAAETGLVADDVVWDRVLSALDHRAGPDAVRRAWSTAFVPNPAVLALVDRLDQPAALLTNNGPLLDACLDAELRPVRDRFSHCLLSCRLRATKPGLEAFRRAADHLGLPPSRLLLVDDRPDNVAAAERAGWQAIPFTDVATLEDRLQARSTGT